MRVLGVVVLVVLVACGGGSTSSPHVGLHVDEPASRPVRDGWIYCGVADKLVACFRARHDCTDFEGSDVQRLCGTPLAVAFCVGVETRRREARVLCFPTESACKNAETDDSLVACSRVLSTSELDAIEAKAISIAEQRSPAPPKATAAVAPPPVSELPRSNWYCAVAALGIDETSRCDRTEELCEGYRAFMSKKGHEARPCYPRERAACFKRTWRLDSPDMSCHASFGDCKRQREYIEKTKRDDIVQLLPCEATE
jgi:hypothetical protein